MKLKTYLGSMTLAVLALGGAVAFAGPGPMGAFSSLDRDGSGTLSLAEFQARSAARFAALDGDGDGMLSAEEMQRQARSFKGRDHARHAAPWAERHAGGGAGAGGPHPISAEQAARMVATLDLDGNGALSAQELATRPGPERLYEQLDTDGDGQLSRAEFLAGRKAGAH